MGWSRVQTNPGASTGTANASITSAFGSSLTAGNRVFVATAHTGSVDITGPSQSAGTATLSTFAKLAEGKVNGANVWVALWTATVTTGGTATIKVTNTASGSDEAGFTAVEYSGLDTSAGTGCLDVYSVGNGNDNNSTNPSTNTTSATTGDNQLAITIVGDWGNNSTWTLQTANGFTKVAGASRDNDAVAGIGYADKTSSLGATESAVWTCGSSNSDLALVAVIKLASGGGGTTATAGLSAATVTAYGPTPQATSAAGNANSTAAAYSPTPQATAAAGNADTTVTASGPVPSVTAFAGVAGVTVTGYNPTVATGGNVTVTPGVASVTVAAYQAVGAVSASAGVGNVTASALAPAKSITVAAGNANSTVAGYNPSPALVGFPGQANVTVAALAPSVTKTGNLTVTAGTANVVAAASSPTISGLQNLLSFTAEMFMLRWTAYTLTDRWAAQMAAQRWESDIPETPRWAGQVNSA